MKAIVIQRITLDPKQISELGVESNVIKKGRVSLSLNEGDLKAVQILKDAKLEFAVIQLGELDNTNRVHTFVRGAGEIYEITGFLPFELSEEKLAAAVCAQINKLSGVDIIITSPVEQDTGRSGLAGLIAGSLGWSIYENVSCISESGAELVITQEFESGVQKLKIKTPSVLCPFEGCGIGDDPSDQFELIEKLEKKASEKISIDALGVSLKGADLISVIPPSEPKAQDAKELSEEISNRIIEKIKEHI